MNRDVSSGWLAKNAAKRQQKCFQLRSGSVNKELGLGPIRTTRAVMVHALVFAAWKCIFTAPPDSPPIPEFVRLLTAMQTSDENGIATPEGSQPGDKVIVPPPQTAQAAEARAGEGYDYTDWCFSKKSL
jgi:hypothetical protein